MAKRDIQEYKMPFVSAYGTGTTIQIPSMQDTIILKPDTESRSYSFGEIKITVTDPNNNTVTIADKQAQSGEYKFQISGQYAIRYFGQTAQTRYPIIPDNPSPPPESFSYTYYVSAVQNQYPPKKHKIKDVVERILRLCEPLIVDRNKVPKMAPPPAYVEEVQNLLQNINELGGVDSFFNYLDALISKGRKEKEYAECFYQNIYKSLLELVGKTRQEAAGQSSEAIMALFNTVDSATVDIFGVVGNKNIPIGIVTPKEE